MQQSLKKLHAKSPFDNYILFTNRSKTGDADDTITRFIAQELGIQNVCLRGTEEITAFLVQYPEIADRYRLREHWLPLRFYEKDIKDIVLAFKKQSASLSQDIRSGKINLDAPFLFVSKEEKNQRNRMSEAYFSEIKHNSLAYFQKIEDFLKNPINEDFLEAYENTVSDLQGVILTKRSEFSSFELLLEKLYDYVLEHSDETVKNHRRLIRVFLHFMYFNCDIGVKSD